MAIVTTDDKHYKAIASAMRDYMRLNRNIKPSDMPFYVEVVFSAGYEDGYSQGLDDGKEAEYDAFWDAFQNNGNAAGMNYYYAFAYNRFTDKNYNPKYDIICLDASSAGRALFYSSKSITDTKVPIRILGTSAQSIFYGCTSLKRIALLQVNEGVGFQNAFGACSALEEINIAGVIGKDIDFSPCKKLSGTSFESIIKALSDTASGRTATFSQEAYNLDEANWDVIWNNLAVTKTNWTITLV